MMQQQASNLAAQAGAVYAETGSWQRAQEWVDTSSSGQAMMGRGMMRGAQHRMGRSQAYVLVEPESGQSLASGNAADPRSIEIGVPILLDGNPIAILAPLLMPSGISQAEAAFISEVNRALTIAAIVGAVVALLAGSLLAASILRPLRRVELAVEQVATGDLAARVTPTGSDEIGRLAAGFNQMASALEQQETLRQRMVSDIAHELRTPLSVVQGNLQAILDDVYPLNRDEVRVILDESLLLGRLVDDLHELAQAEARRLPLAVEPVDAPSVLNHMGDLFRPSAEKKAVQLTIEPGPPQTALADPARLQQMLHNLVANALRHTPAGGQVSLSAAPQPGRVRFMVRDSGPGVPAADLPHVFDRFYRAERDRSRQDPLTSGAGLGLAIVKALAEAQGGAVGASSAPNQGSVFWVDLPEVRP
jgi:two-component system OmpR family sensor kinase/two-component system sensor histidine kinase BaeS